MAGAYHSLIDRFDEGRADVREALTVTKELLGIDPAPTGKVAPTNDQIDVQHDAYRAAAQAIEQKRYVAPGEMSLLANAESLLRPAIPSASGASA